MSNKNKIIDKEKKHIIIDLDKNDFYNYIQNDLLKYCQFRKGINGMIEKYEEKKDEEIINKNNNKKKIIKNYNKNDIKVNKNYILCENLTEEEIIPELYEDDENEINENNINELANSLRCSIDKSFSNSINKSLKKSYNQSYAEGIYDSIDGSKLKFSGGKGILSKLNQVFGNSFDTVEEEEIKE